MLRGAEVILIYGAVSAKVPPFVKTVEAVSAQDMFEAVMQYAPQADYVFKAAAVADYTPVAYSDDKMKKKEGDLCIPLKRTTDILAWLGANRRDGQVICGFSMETRDMLENSRTKLHKKNVDMICANNLKQEGAGFGVDTNVVTLISKTETKELPLMSKLDVANAILTALKDE